MLKTILPITLPVLLLAGCNVDPQACPCNADRGDNDADVSSESGTLVNLQITEYQDAEAFEKIISEVEARGIKATVLTKPDFVTENCQRVRDLHDAGFEIMAFARPETQEGESTSLSMLSYEEQEAHISSVKNAIEDCLGTSIEGFRCTRFDQNDDTYEVLDSLAFDYNLGFVAHTDRCLPEHEEDTLPYRAPDHNFWVVPMHSVLYDGEWVPFCDNPFEELVDAAGWEALLKSELDYMSEQGRPLLVEVHPYNSGNDEGRFSAFVGFLDYAVQQNARFVTVAELVDWSELYADADCGCLGD